MLIAFSFIKKKSRAAKKNNFTLINLSPEGENYKDDNRSARLASQFKKKK